MADTIADVSPDMAFGLELGGQNTGGRMVTIVADPRDPKRLYAAGQLSGVWVSRDAARTWTQSVRGLGTGSSCVAQPVLAIDPRNPRRLLYTTFEDFRPGNPTAGLYLSVNSAASWRRVPLPASVGKSHGTVGFSVDQAGRDHPWVQVAEGLLIADTRSTTYNSPRQWLLVPGPVATIGGPRLDPTHVISDGSAIIACFGNTVYRTTVDQLLARGPDASWVGSAGLPRDFTARAMTLAPERSAQRRAVIVLGTVTRVSVCPAGQAHAIDRSGDYVLGSSGSAGQGGWRRCDRCGGLWFSGNPGLRNVCPAGGAHTAAGETDYRLPTSPSGEGQAGWRYCRNCQGLWFQGNDASVSRCPAGGAHVATGSGDYVLPAGAGSVGEHGWRFCSSCRGLVYATVLEAWQVDPGVSAASKLGGVTRSGGSGRYVVGAPATTRRDGSFDLVVGDQLVFYHGVAGAGSPSASGGVALTEIPDLHRDTWSIAFPADYATVAAPAPIYLAHDGGVSVRHGDGWVTAMHGLHGYKSANLAGVTVNGRDALYVPSGDNDLWASRDGGTTWEAMGGLVGDAGAAFLDPRVPGQVAASRNGTAGSYRSASPATAPPGAADTRYYLMRDGASGTLTGLSPEGGTEPPQIPGFAQIMTESGGDPVSVGDYLTLRNDADPSGIAQILRSSSTRAVSGGGTERVWRAVTSDQTTPSFEPGSILAIAASGGHRHTRVYLLHRASGGIELLRSDIDAATGTFSTFVTCSGDVARGQPVRPQTLVADPWDSDVVYVWDGSGTSTIKSSADGGDTWREEPALKRRATNNGEYAFGFQRGSGDVRCGPLQSMVFSPVDGDFRLAVLFPGGLAFTRNAGEDWYPVGDDLSGTEALAGARAMRDLLAIPYSAFLTGREGAFRLYVALVGRGVVRIDTALRTVKPSL